MLAVALDGRSAQLQTLLIRAVLILVRQCTGIRRLTWGPVQGFAAYPASISIRPVAFLTMLARTST